MRFYALFVLLVAVQAIVLNAKDEDAEDVVDTGADPSMPRPAPLSIKSAQGKKEYRNQPSQIKDALQDGPCTEVLNYTSEEMLKNLDYFSRRLDPVYFERAMAIHQELAGGDFKKVPLNVNTFELYDKAFEFPRVRRYEFVQ